MNKYIKITLAILSLLFLAWELHLYLPTLIEWVRGLGMYAVIGFFILYCLTVLFFLPIEPVVLASGAIFGFYTGFFINLFCAVVSAAIAFMLSRQLGLAWMSLHQKGRLSTWIKYFETWGWKSLAISRLTPFIPCAVINYGYGMTNIGLFAYTITNLISFIPYKLIVTYIGAQL